MEYDEIAKHCETLHYRDKLRLSRLLIQLARKEEEIQVSGDLAWNAAKLAHGPWRLSRSPELEFASPERYFTGLGLPRLYEKQV